MTVTGDHPAEPHAATRRAEAPAAPSEPATARALWPTFLRRTLAEDALHQPRPEPAS